jgi:hypothetical protein
MEGLKLATFLRDHLQYSPYMLAFLYNLLNQHKLVYVQIDDKVYVL